MQKESTMLDRINESVEFLKTKTESKPLIGIILGTGLGDLVKKIKLQTVVPYGDIPHFPISTVESHSGKLIFGKIDNIDVVVMQGRFHYYEGYSMQQITYPVRVMKFLGVENLIVSNACGSLNPLFPKGSIMIIDDHINLIGDNPLIGKHEEWMGPRFVDMSEPYSQELIRITEQLAAIHQIRLFKGVYAAMSGPSLETRAEYRFLRTIGADAIGMSTIPECIVANQMGIKTIGFSILTDECYPDSLRAVSLEEIIETAGKAEPHLTRLITALINEI